MSIIDTTNKFCVGSAPGEISILLLMGQSPFRYRMTKIDALNLAAWLVAIADPDGEEFARVLDAVRRA